MSFDQSQIQDVSATPVGRDLRISWVSAVGGATFQTYLDRQLAWFGTATTCLVPMPSAGISVTIDVGIVDAIDAPFSQLASLPVPSSGGQRVTLRWLGGSFLGSVDHFNVYSGLTPGGAVSYAARIGRVVAYESGIVQDGYGVGGYGQGGYGISAQNYTWTSLPLAPGTWNFAVRAADLHDIESSSITQSATVSGPPKPPARNAAGQRLTYAFVPGGVVATGYGIGGYGDGGYGVGGPVGYGGGGYGLGGYGVGAAHAAPSIVLSWLPSPGY